jgi:hypothetical protein
VSAMLHAHKQCVCISIAKWRTTNYNYQKIPAYLEIRISARKPCLSTFVAKLFLISIYKVVISMIFCLIVCALVTLLAMIMVMLSKFYIINQQNTVIEQSPIFSGVVILRSEILMGRI